MAFSGAEFYVHQNDELFYMATQEFDIRFNEIDRVDRKNRKVELLDGRVFDMPEHWNVGTPSRPA